MSKTVLVIGMMRSGTSLLAGLCHRLGFHAGTRTFMPLPPTWRLDYEDVELSELLIQRLWPTPGWWIDYIRRRHSDSEMLGFGGRITIKCPFLALCWGDLTLAVEKVDGCAPVVIRTFRQQMDVEASMAAHPGLKAKDQADIRRALYRDVSPTLEFSYEAMVDDPLRMVGILAAGLGVKDDAAIRGAVALVGKPTEYPCKPLPSSP